MEFRQEKRGRGAYPRIVKHTLIRRSGPHPAIMATPAGGTAIHELFVMGMEEVACLQIRVIRTKKTVPRTPIFCFEFEGEAIH